MSRLEGSRRDGISGGSGGEVESDWWGRLHVLLEQKTGLVLNHTRSMVSDLLRDRLSALGLSKFDDYFSLLHDPAGGEREWPILLSKLTVHESYFFRDPEQLAVIENNLLPELLSRDGGSCDLTLWSAGCACGEETYTLAMILNKFLPEPAGSGRQIRILGTDIDPACIQQARHGCYRAWSFRHVSGDILETFFHKEENESYRIDPRLAAWTQFMQLNLFEAGDTLGWGQRFDLVLCRNVFIYLSTQAVQRILAIIFALLKPGGYLVTGHGETDRPFMEKSGYVLRAFPHSHVYQKPAVALCRPLETTSRTYTGSRSASLEHPVIVSGNPPGSEATEAEAVEAVCNRMRQLIAEGHNAMARIVGESALLVIANNAHIRTLLAWALANLGELARAEEACLAAIRVDPTASMPHHLLGQILSDSKRFTDAMHHFQIAIYLDPGAISAMIELGNTLAQLGRRQEACREWQAALDQLRREPLDHYVGCLDRWPVKTVIADLKRMIHESC